MAIKTEPPSSVAAGSAFGLTVQVEDSQGNAVSGGTVTVALGNNPGGAMLGGTLTEPVIDGLATFSDLTLSQPGTGYTLIVTASGIASSQTTTPITVTAAAADATQVVVTASPSAPVFGQAVTLNATVSFLNSGTGVPTGTVTFDEGSTTLGTVTLTDGVAELSTTPSAVGTETITASYSGDDQSSSIQFDLTVGQAAATLRLGNLNFTYDGSPHTASVTTNPAGLSGVRVTYTQNGVDRDQPDPGRQLHGDGHARQPGLRGAGRDGDPGHRPGDADAHLGRSREHHRRHSAGHRPARCHRHLRREDAAGRADLHAPAGTVLPAGNGQTLTVTFTPTDDTDFQAVTSSVSINVVPQSTSTPTPTPTPTPSPMPTPSPTPTPVTVIGEVPVFQRKLNKHGKPVGKAVLTGFTLDFSTSLSAAAALSPGNYQLDTATTKRVKRKLDRVLHPIERFTVTYAPASDSVTLELTGTQTFPKGGQLTVLPGVTGASDIVLDGTTVFTIAPGGKSIGPS